ncbi:glycogen debranching protein GlgX, partial [Actinotalea sp.]|uniref:glycogen debranching protein GlgX n=1 Tax=Actinotalea sp. TaxID=1872145 RepID=UPI002BE68D06
RGDESPATPWGETVVYEMHVKGYTQQHPLIPDNIRGTYAGLAHPAAIEHLTSLGVTAVELLPVHHSVAEPALAARGTRNYWGYSTLGFFAPHAAYSADKNPGAQVGEFKYMVRELHAAGIEVILDVVYNHTCEGGPDGPSLSFRGLGERDFYKLAPHSGHYVDTTGCGNTLDVGDLDVLRLVMDSLRYWVTEMHVDGFRFDLASTLARQFHEVDRLSAFFDLVQQDPVISQVKLIAEPWDVGDGGYQVGGFPPLWSEWNGKYRDTVRDFWRGEPSTLAEFASRLSGSSDLYEHTGRKPIASINFVTAHDGFTLYDLTSYNDKHNEANGEGNNDGESHNRSWNCGVEGPTKDKAIEALRWRQQRNFIATLLLSQGVPMLAHGDELGRTQGGNNNGYCQDNEVTWVDWALDKRRQTHLTFVRDVVRLRSDHPVLRRRRFFAGSAEHGGESELGDIAWFTTNGGHMSDADWQTRHARAVQVFLNGEAIAEPDVRGERVVDDSFLLLYNAAPEGVTFTLPPAEFGAVWTCVLDTDHTLAPGRQVKAGTAVTLTGRSTLVLTRPVQAP